MCVTLFVTVSLKVTVNNNLNHNEHRMFHNDDNTYNEDNNKNNKDTEWLMEGGGDKNGPK